MKKSSIVARVEKTIAAYGLLKKGDHVLIGLSGGPDSTALLHILNKLRRKLDLSLGAIYINHQLRPRSAKKEADFCEKLCDSLMIDFHYNEINIALLAEKEKKAGPIVVLGFVAIVGVVGVFGAVLRNRVWTSRDSLWRDHIQIDLVAGYPP